MSGPAPAREGLPALFYLMVVAAVALILAWGVAEKGPTRWDDSWYLAGAVRLFDRFADEGLGGYWRGFEHALGDKAPLITVLPFPFFCLIGRSTYVIYLVNSVGCVVLALALYHFCRRFFERPVALWAVFFALTSALLAGLSRLFLVEYWLTAFTLCALLALARWEETGRNRWLLALGVCCGLGLLMKITFPLFAGPVVAVILLRARRQNLPRVLGDIVLIAIPAVALAGPWYFHNWALVTRRSFQESYFVPVHPTAPQSPVRLAADYVLLILNNGLSSVHVVAALAGMVVWLAARRRNFLGGAAWYLLPWVVGLPVFAVSENRDLRLIAPMIPAFAIAIAAVFTFALDRAAATIRRVSSAAVVIGLLLVTAGHSFAAFGDRVIKLGPWQLFSSTFAYAFPPNPQHWPLDEVIHRMAWQERLGRGSWLIVGMGADTWSFNSNNLDLQTALLHYPMEFHTTAYTSNPDEVRLIMSRTQYFLLKDGGTQQPLSRFQGGPLTRDVLLSGALFRESEPAIPTPDGGRIRIFQNASAEPDAFLPARQSATPPELPPATLNFSNQLQVTGLRLTEADGVFTLALKWKCLNPPPIAYRCFAHVLDGEGKLLSSMDHEILHGSPPVNEWQPGDEGYEARYLVLPAAKAQGAQIRLGLFDPETRLRVPLQASTLPLKDDYTAAVVEPNRAPPTEVTFRLEPAPLVPVDVLFDGGLRLTGYSVKREGGVAWLRLRWEAPASLAAPLRFFGHAVQSQELTAGILASFDNDLGLDRMPRSPEGRPRVFVQDIARDVSKLDPAIHLLRAGVFDFDHPLDRVAVRSSSLPMSRPQKAIYLPLP
jgi:4-amino-4-deoxy-L-arabinose transferase-like glycosyltransferase